MQGLIWSNVSLLVEFPAFKWSACCRCDQSIKMTSGGTLYQLPFLVAHFQFTEESTWFSCQKISENFIREISRCLAVLISQRRIPFRLSYARMEC